MLLNNDGFSFEYLKNTTVVRSIPPDYTIKIYFLQIKRTNRKDNVKWYQLRLNKKRIDNESLKEKWQTKLRRISNFPLDSRD